MKKLLLLAFCTVTIISSETKYVFKAEHSASGVCIKKNLTGNSYSLHCLNGTVDYEQDLIYDMVNYKYTNLSSSLKGDALADFFRNNAFKKSAYYYVNNPKTEHLKPFAFLNTIQSINNDKQTNYFIINEQPTSTGQTSYKVEIILAKATIFVGQQHIRKLIITQTVLSNLPLSPLPLLSSHPKPSWQAKHIIMLTTAFIGINGLIIAAYGIYYKWFKK